MIRGFDPAEGEQLDEAARLLVVGAGARRQFPASGVAAAWATSCC